MPYFLNLFSAETWSAFQKAGSRISGFSKNQLSQSKKIKEDDVFLCYLVGLSRWCGALKVNSKSFVDESPIFKAEKDPFIVRFEVEPVHIFDPEYAIPVTLETIWSRLSWTSEIQQGSVGWGANFQRSLREIPDDDAEFLLAQLKKQSAEKQKFELSSKDQRIIRRAATVRTSSGEVSVAIPEQDDESESLITSNEEKPQSRESHIIQGILAEIGAKMGFQMWLPRNDRERVQRTAKKISDSTIVDTLPMNYNDATIRTIEQIDVLWLRGRSIARAFEVEHTTAIYSGLLRMADLVALQPDINIPLHIVAPIDRKDTVIEQIKRPVFSLFETGPLSERCTYISYESVRELAELPHLNHLNQSILEEFTENAEI